MSTFDPTAHPVQGNSDTARDTRDTTTTDAEDKAQEPPPKAEPEQTPKPICKKLATAVNNSTELLDIFEYIADEASSDSNPVVFWREDIGAIEGYERAYSQYSNWLQRVQLADSTATYPSKCGREYFGQKRTELGLQPGYINGDEKKAFSKKIILEMKSCVSIVSKNPINAYQRGNCKVFESGNERYRILG